MGLDYTEGCVNFRDFGAYINIILEKEVLPEGKLFRGGSIDYVESLDEIGKIQSVANLRNGKDSENFEVDYYHFPMSNKIEKYNTSLKEVRVWLNSILKIFEEGNLKFPILIHCLSGKDRTGIIVAALLLILGIEKNAIEEEYLLSQGDVQLALIQESIKGFENIEQYFNRVDLKKIRTTVFKQLESK